MKAFTAAIVGAGNLSTHLCAWLSKANIEVKEVYNRTPEHAERLIKNFPNITIKCNLDFSQSSINILFICVSDSAIASIAELLTISPDCLVVHCSGNTALKVLQRFKNHGIYYPIQTFSLEKTIDQPDLNIAIEANNEASIHFLKNLALQLHHTIYILNSYQRKQLHLAAVFACNFTNALWNIAFETLQEEGISFKVLQPLINETLQKALGAEQPSKVQTGPAIRNDLNTIAEHMQLLKNQRLQQDIYQSITQYIQKKA
jgi:predicted short-subunit dehydrogenase-like oxidoreductase (DUF2520 family)